MAYHLPFFAPATIKTQRTWERAQRVVARPVIDNGYEGWVLKSTRLYSIFAINCNFLNQWTSLLSSSRLVYVFN